MRVRPRDGDQVLVRGRISLYEARGDFQLIAEHLEPAGEGALRAAFEAGEMEQDLVAVVRFQGPAANGMPELHKMTPFLGVLQDLGFKVALVTDGRMSGASGKVPAAIHLAPEAAHGGMLARLQDGDMLELDAEQGILKVELSAEELAARELASMPAPGTNLGRNLFRMFRANNTGALQGASAFGGAFYDGAD